MIKGLLLCSSVLFCLSGGLIAQDSGEFRIFGGINGGRDRGSLPRVGPSVGFDVAFKVAPIVKITGGYTYNSTGSYDTLRSCVGGCVTVRAKAEFHEVLGGIQVGPNKGRVMPYLGAGIGVVDFVASSRATGGLSASLKDSSSSFAYAGGGGLNIRFGNRWGIALDERIVKARDLAWYARSAVGILVRF